MFSGCFDVILPHKKSTWTDFGGIYTPYTPVATPLCINTKCHNPISQLASAFLRSVLTAVCYLYVLNGFTIYDIDLYPHDAAGCEHEGRVCTQQI